MTNGAVSPELDVTALQHELEGCVAEIARLRRVNDNERALHAYWKQAARRLLAAFAKFDGGGGSDTTDCCQQGPAPSSIQDTEAWR